MKSILLVAFFCVGAVLAQTPSPLVASLELRGHLLYERATKVLIENRGTHDHLLESLNHHVGQLVDLLKELHELAVQDAHAGEHVHKIHVIEERLLHEEGRISEEIAIIEDTKTNHHPKPETVEQIVARAEKLIAQAKETVAKHPKAQEVTEIERQLIIINALIGVVKGKLDPVDLKNEEQELTRQEKTLQVLIERASARN